MVLNLASLVVVTLFVFATPTVSLRQTADECSPAALDGMSPRARKLAEGQPTIDAANDRYTPRLSDDSFEDVPILGRVEIGDLIGRSRTSTIFVLESHPDYVIKYQTNCDLLRSDVHPLLTDYWLGLRAALAGAGARPFSVSPAALLRDGYSKRKIYSTMDDSSFHNCTRDGGVVRYMVMERMGQCTHSHTLTPNFRAAIEAGNNVVHLLQLLHNAGIYHGDIHVGNVCESRTTPGAYRLIDFGLGGFIDGESDGPVRRPHGVHPLLTEWQLLGKEFARRDDIYRSMELMATIAIGKKIWDIPKRWARDDPESLLRWKQHGSPFVVSPDVDAFAQLTHMTPDAQAIVRDTLARVVQMARLLESVSTPIPYDRIRADLNSVIILLDTAVTSTTTVTTSAPDCPELTPLPPVGCVSRWRRSLAGLRYVPVPMTVIAPSADDESPDSVRRSRWCPPVFW